MAQDNFLDSICECQTEPRLNPTPFEKVPKALSVSSLLLEIAILVFQQRARSGLIGALLLLSPTLCLAGVPKGPVKRSQTNDSTIIVTARRRSEPLRQIPLAATVFNQNEIEQHQIHTLLDLANHVPSFSGYSTQSDPNGIFATELRLRGLPGTVVYLAEVPIADADYSLIGLEHGLSEGNLYDLEDVEVLRGPQGTLFGKNSIGGLIAYQPRRPTGSFGGYARVSTGSYRDREAEFAVNIPLVPDKFSIRVAAQLQRRAGYTRELTQNTALDGKSYNAFRIGFRFNPTYNLDAFLMYDDYRQNSHGSSIVFSALSPTSFLGKLYPTLLEDLNIQQKLGIRAVVGDDYEHRGYDHIYGITEITTWQPGNQITIKNIIAARVTKQLPTNDFTYIGSSNAILFIGIAGHNTELANNSTQVTEELQVQGLGLNTKLHWIIGAYLEDSRPNAETLLASLVLQKSQIGSASFYHYTVIERSKALFINLDYDVGTLVPGLKLAAGYRYTWDFRSTSAIGTTGVDAVRRDATARALNCTGLFLTDNNCLQKPPPAHFSSGGWTMSAAEQLTPKVLIYVRAGSAYRPGGINLNVPAQFAAFAPEHVTDVELGLKTDWKLIGMHGNVSADVFHTSYRDIQVRGVVPVIDPQGNTRISTLQSNAARATLDGAEFEGWICPVLGVKISSHGSYLRSKYGDYPVALNSTGDRTPFLYSPKWSFGINTTVNLPIRENAGTISVSADYSWNGSQFASTVQTDPGAKLSAHDLLSARLDWNEIDGSLYSIGFWMNNAANSTFRTGSIPLYSTLGFTAFTYNSPRMFGITIKRRFGTD